VQSSDAHETVVAFLPIPATDARGLGLLSDLRGLVAMARRCHPELTHCNVVDVGIKHEGDRLRATLRFASPRL
jgi:hypothetical protein